MDAEFLSKWNLSVPRYTSYPTAPQFHSMEPLTYLEALLSLEERKEPLSLYIHIPFCRTMCLFCACSVVLNRRRDKQEAYLQTLFQEIDCLPFHSKPLVAELHLGGGTPTSLQEEEMASLMEKLKSRFSFSQAAEISIEIDPRTVFTDQGKKLLFLKELGFTRVSFGVQDLDPKVQEAVRRRQSKEVTFWTFYKARELGFEGINLDLIYGLPLQTAESFRETIAGILEMRPDRIAFFSYAKVPWIKKHQRAISDGDLPSKEVKFQIYVETRQALIDAGYVAIGMDHFALPEDSLTLAYQTKTLTRNFQGYSRQLSADLLGLGMSSIGKVGGNYFQNAKTLESYEAHLQTGRLPVEKGYLLSFDDRVRSFVIERLMCNFELDKQEVEARFSLDFDLYFVDSQKRLKELEEEGFFVQDAKKLIPTELGKLMIRLIASCFDRYLKEGTYSRVI